MRYKKSASVVAVVFLLVLASLACGNVFDLSDADAPTQPASQPQAQEGTGKSDDGGALVLPSGGKNEAQAAPAATSVPDSGDGSAVTFTVVNDLNAAICYVLLSPSTADTWGDDWLGGEEIVAIDATRNFNLAPGAWDIALLDCDGDILVEQYNINIAANLRWQASQGLAAVSPPSTGGGPVVTLINNSGSPVCYVLISATTSDDWGSDWLGDSQIIDTGYSLDFNVAAGQYDLRADDCNGNMLYEEYGVTVSGSGLDWTIGSQPQAQSGGASTVAFTVQNNTSETVCYVAFGLPASEWIGDLLGDEVLDPYSSITVYVEPGTYALQALDCDQVMMQFTGRFNIYDGAVWVVDPGAASTGVCGNDICEPGEDAFSCEWDCSFCPDGVCTGMENESNCPEDCGQYISECGNGVCDYDETSYSCEIDCSYCGDGICNSGLEDASWCAVDCAGGETQACGDGMCDANEDVYSCAIDCGICGDLICTVFENPGNCPSDCY